jgi:transcriptional regulator with XRE-family HTH domain
VEPDQASELGQYLRHKREALGLSTRQLAKRSGVNDVTISRIERGEFAAPRPDKLAKLADALGISGFDLLERADYVTADELPNFVPYLRSKYQDLPEEAVAQIERYVGRLAKKHGVAIDGPAPGEDEAPVP